VLNSQRRAGGGRISAVGRLLAVSVGAGLLVAAVAVPLFGAAGVVTRNAANTFNTLKVPSLGQIPSRSEILDADGNLIAYYYPKNIYRVPVAYNQIAPVMRNAIVAIEDSRFYAHGAFDLRGTLRALANDLSSNSNPQGGSTLAQEYVKNALILTATSKQQQQDASEDTVVRKIRELRMAAVVEHEMTKQQLLAAYLNAAYYDESAYGIQVAAERYFSTSAADLTLPQAALLAGLVRNPTAYNPVYNPGPATDRRNTVLTRMAQVGYITRAQAAAAEKLPLGLKMSTLPLQSGCLSQSAASDAFFCDYVLSAMRTNPAFAVAKQMLNTVGGLKIYTTLNPQDEKAANDAVNWVAPANSGALNPGRNVDTEVLIQPGTGKVRAIAVDRPYGSGPGQTTVDYAVETQYDGSTGGVQTGSSSKIFTLITALKQGIPFGFNMSVVNPSVVGPFTNCQGGIVPAFQFNNAENANPKPEIFTLYNGTTQSINIFYAQLEQKVGLCSVVKTAASMGMTFVNGGNLLKPDRAIHQESADNDSSFTLGSVPVAPMSMAAAYASVAARGMYCSPIAVSQILNSSGGSLPVQSANCHQAFPAAVADAANYILQGVLSSPGTAANRGINVPAAGKTGTANGGFYAAFAGYTPHLTGYVSVFNPIDPTTGGAMIGNNSCYREDLAFGGGENCPGQMFGDNAPAATWQMTFSNAAVGPGTPFVGVPLDSPFFSMGNGVNSPKPPKPPKRGGGGGGRGGGGGGGNGGGGNGKGKGNGGPGGPPTAGPTAPVGGLLQAPLGVLPPARLP
jgi:membrane peptidoglycan carboxypeptidase